MDAHDVGRRFAYGIEMHQAGNFQEAEKAYRDVLTQNPHHIDALNNMSVLASHFGKHDIAEKLLLTIVNLQPNHSEAYNNLGNIFRNSQRYDEAIIASEKALQCNSNNASTYYNYGLSLQMRQRNADAIHAYRKAISMQPDMHEAYSSLGTALFDCGLYEEALTYFTQALEIQPHFCEAHNNYGLALMKSGRWEESILAFEQAIQLAPNDAICHSNLASAEKDLFQLKNSIRNYRKALELLPNQGEIRSNYLLVLNYDPDTTPEQLFQESKDWQKFHGDSLRHRIPLHSAHRDLNKRLRLGFISPDLRQHSVAYFLMPLVDHIDRTQFEIYFYSDVRTADESTTYFEKKADGWRNCCAAKDAEVADLINQDAIDILIDLAGHTAFNRLRVFARKPAPIQISWLGYPNTTGLETIDYRFTDEISDPPGTTQQYHTEKLVYIPQCAWCFRPDADTPDIVELPALKNSHITFGSFNAMPKINEPLLEIWAEILRKTPHSRIYLKNKSLGFPLLQKRIRDIFQNNGIEADRLEMSDQLPDRNSHLASYGRVDISLDTFPYHGTTTTCEAFWMGVPVVTMAGKTHASRVGVSLLQQIDRTNWVANNPQEYVRIATNLAADLELLACERKNLRNLMKASPLMDEALFAHNIQNKIRELWQRGPRQ